MQNKTTLTNILLVIVILVYFMFLYQYYDTNYVVPDYKAYTQMPLSESPTINTYSSLFIKIAHLASISTKIMLLLCLTCLTAALFLFNFGFILLTNSLVARTVFLFASFSVGSWYYFYGKLYYDFPFSAISMAAAFLFFSLSIKRKKHTVLYRNIFYILSGFALSWKGYNIFAILPMILFGTVYSIQVYKLSLSVKSLTKEILLCSILVVFGYSLGNFTLYTQFMETVKGLIGNTETSLLSIYFFHGTNQWDNVNSVAFNRGVIFLPSLVLIICTTFLQKKTVPYGIISIFTFILFLFFIKYFSPGFLWHGFSIGIMLFLLLGFILLSLEDAERKLKKIIFPMFFIALSMQIINNIQYIKIQNKWHYATMDGIKVVELNQVDIVENAQSLIDKYGAPNKLEIYPMRWKYIYPELFIFNINNSFMKQTYLDIIPPPSSNDVKYILRIIPKVLIKYDVPFYHRFERRFFIKDFGDYVIDGIII